MVKRVDSCPQCKELLDVKVAKGLSIRSPDAHIAPVQSKKYLRDADMLPNLVGLPSAKPEQNFKSSCEQ